VPPFNGRLFSPARAPIAESCAVDDEVARGALLALSTTKAIRTSPRRQRGVFHQRRVRIDYRDLGVEQLGAVYESVLDYEPAFAESGSKRILLRRGMRSCVASIADVRSDEGQSPVRSPSAWSRALQTSV